MWCRHQWVVAHPSDYQDDVRIIRCRKCLKEATHSVVGEGNQPITFGFDVTTLRPMFGHTATDFYEWRRGQERSNIDNPLIAMMSKVQFLIDRMDKLGLLEDHSLTFPDGDTWAATREVANAPLP